MSKEKKQSVIVLQPGIPSYRVDFFERLYKHYGDVFSVYASPLDLGALTDRKVRFEWEHSIGPIYQLFKGAIEWQSGALSVPIKKGDVLVLWGAPRSVTNIIGMIIARVKGAKVIWWGHYLSPGSRPWRLVVRTFLMKWSNALLFYTEEEVSAYRATPSGREDLRPVCALNNGIDTERVSRLRKEYRAEERPNSALFIGRITEKAQLRVAIEALAKELSGTLQLHVIGDGPDLPMFKAMAEELGLGDRVFWYGGTTDEGKIAEIANRCRFFLYPGDIGLSLLHALSYALPVAVHSNRAEHMPEIAAFRDGWNGLGFEKGSPTSLAAIFSDLATNAALLNKLSRNAVATTASEFNTTRMSERFIDCVAEVLEVS